MCALKQVFNYRFDHSEQFQRYFHQMQYVTRPSMKCCKNLMLFTIIAMNLVDQPAPEVHIDQGTLSGKISVDGSFYEYLGIPYATTNSSFRFKAPLPPPSWEGVFKAIEEIHQCPQTFPQSTTFTVLGNEDCLKINVYVPVTAKKQLPVMVFIHGGTFIMGYGGKFLYGPKFLVQQEVILVTFNYRLGALGFLCLGIKEAPGNAGLKDQIAALKWVKKNIAAFGGDPDNVTLFGLSAGATSVSLLIASKATEGLFNKAIVQSGSAISNWAVNRQPLEVASLVVKELGYITKDPKTIYEIFSKLDHATLIYTDPPIKPLGMYFENMLLYQPCIENEIVGEESVLTDLPYNLITANSKNISIIYGTNNKEGMLVTAADTEESLYERNKQYVFSSDLEFSSEEEAANVSQMIKEFYFKDKNMSLETHNGVLDWNTHLYFEVPAILESEIVIKNSDAPVYNYYFEYSGSRNFIKYVRGVYSDPGACHADEMLYLFNGYVWPYPINRNDKKIIEWMTKMWTNFAKSGNPTPKGSDLPITWIPSSKSELKFLYIDNELKMGSMPNPEAYKLWNDTYKQYRRMTEVNDFKT